MSTRPVSYDAKVMYEKMAPKDFDVMVQARVRALEEGGEPKRLDTYLFLLYILRLEETIKTELPVAREAE